MISFRYHLVSVIAIFLAIALGVVVGTSALNGAVVGDLRRQVSDLKSSDSAAGGQNRALQARAGNADLLAQTFGAKIVGAALAKVPVVLVGAPGATKAMKDAIASEITAAGGTVAARLQLSQRLHRPETGQRHQVAGHHRGRIRSACNCRPPTTPGRWPARCSASCCSATARAPSWPRCWPASAP